MKRRTRAREVAVQMLYLKDINSSTASEALRQKISAELNDQEMADFAWSLVAGTLNAQQQLDEQIEQVANNWTLKRMAPTDRNVLRLGAYELIHTETHFRIVIDEAVELGRRFGTKNSGPFVNGILDKLIPEEKRDESNSQQTVEGE